MNHVFDRLQSLLPVVHGRERAVFIHVFASEGEEVIQEQRQIRWIQSLVGVAYLAKVQNSSIEVINENNGVIKRHRKAFVLFEVVLELGKHDVIELLFVDLIVLDHLLPSAFEL